MGNKNSGRRPKPTALKVLRGNPGQRPLNQHEPQPPAGVVTMPKRLSGPAREVWAEIAPIAEAMGTLTTADVWAFARLCELQSLLDMAAMQKDAPAFAPFTVSADFDGAPKMGLHAAVKLEKELSPVIRPFYEKFGLEPVGRARIAVPKTKPATDGWADMGIA